MKNGGAVGCAMFAVGLLLAGGAGAEPPRSYFSRVPSAAADVWNEATLLVERLEAFSPAEDTGLQPGERVIGVNGMRVRTMTELSVAKEGLVGRDGLSLEILRDGKIVSLPVGKLDEQGRLGMVTTSPALFVDRIALETMGIKPSEYLGVGQGGRDDGGALEALIANYTPTSGHHCHPVLLQFAVFPPRAIERIRALSESDKAGARAWVVGLLKVYYALVESRWDDAKKHIKDAKLLTTPMDPFLDGLADFYRRLADAPPDATRGVDLKRYGVTPEYFAICYPAPVLPLKLHDWSQISRQFAADFARRADGLPRKADESERAAQREFVTSSKVLAVDYMHMVRGALLNPEVHGGWPTRYSSLYKKDKCAEILSTLKGIFATNTLQRELAALSLIVPSILMGDTNAYRQAITALRDAGSREIGVANNFTVETWMRHGSLPSYETFEAIRREVNDSLKPPGVYQWLAARNQAYAERQSYGWYYMTHGGLTDGSDKMHTSATVQALGGPKEPLP